MLFQNPGHITIALPLQRKVIGSMAQEHLLNQQENIKVNPVAIIKTATIAIDLLTGLGIAASKLHKTFKPKKDKEVPSKQVKKVI